MPFDEIRQRLEAVQRVRAQRDAAERRVPGERLRRGLREAFAGKRASEPDEDEPVGAPAKPLDDHR
jgi:hypothetical protein